MTKVCCRVSVGVFMNCAVNKGLSDPGVTAARDEGIAIIGMSCRFAPDTDSLEKFWSMLADGRDAVCELPAGRWEPPGDPQTAAVMGSCTRYAAFMTDVAGFDAAFFGISPREAVSIDPQQRIVLELAWEALEHAGIPPLGLSGCQAGVFVAATCHDYGDRLVSDLPSLEAWAVNGVQGFGLSNRVSYVLNLRGASMTVDAACAGSLTAVHLACVSLWRGESAVAVAGGVNVIAGPGPVVALDAAGATAGDGRSKAFDADADGYGCGEGAGIVVLKRLADAERDGDRILAVVRGSGVFHDGTGDGFMVPNGLAQEHMLREVYGRAGIAPETVGYVEAHGTGTPVGDPIEAEVLSHFFGARRPGANPCLIGSVKPNVGHLEAGAGMASLIKTVLAVQKSQIPASLHTELTTAVDWARSGLRVVPTLTPWPVGAGPRRAGVSSFGVGGTIAHLIVEQAAETTTTTTQSPSGPVVVCLSNRSGASLRQDAARLANWVDAHADTPLSAIAGTLALRRSPLEQRAVTVARDRADLIGALRGFARGDDDRVTTAHVLPGGPHDPVWVFSGHGAQWAGMGRQLLAQEPAFAAVMDRIDPIFEDELGITANQAIAEGDWTSMSRTQAMTFAMQIGLAQLWRERGLRPAAIVGHSLGETAAAVVAGALDLEAAARFTCRRGLIGEQIAGAGAMAMVNMPFEQARSRVCDGVEIAIMASPTWTVVTGDVAPVESTCAQWVEEGFVVRRVNTTVAFHSAQVDPLVEQVITAAHALSPRPPEVPLYSSVSIDPRSQALRDGQYWGEMMRRPVRFVSAIEAAIDDGHRMFVEISSHPLVAQSITEILDERGIDEAVVAHTLLRNKPEVDSLLKNLAVLHCNGAAVDWSRTHRDRQLVDLPTTAWQHRPYWPEPTPRNLAHGAGHDPAGHTLLGTELSVSGIPALRIWQTRLDDASRPYPGRHVIHDVEIMPASVILLTMLAATGQHPTSAALADVEFRVPLSLSAPRDVQVVRHASALRLAGRDPDRDADGTATDAGHWVTHASATTGTPLADCDRVDIAALRRRCAHTLDQDSLMARLTRSGVTGAGFDWRMQDLWFSNEEFVGTVDIAVGQDRDPLVTWAPVLDAAITALSVLVPDDGTAQVLAAIESVRLAGETPAFPVVYGRIESDRTVDVVITDEHGVAHATLTGLRMELLENTSTQRIDPRAAVHELLWRPRTANGRSAPRRVGLVCEDRIIADALREQFTEIGVDCRVAAAPVPALVTESDTVVVVPAAEGPIPDVAEQHAWLPVHTAQVIAEAGCRVPPKLWCVTRGVRTGTNPAGAGAWGVARILAGEHPEFWGGLIDLDPDVPAAAAAGIVGGNSGEDIIAVTDTGQLVPRLARIDRDPSRPDLECRSESTYLVTGGLGELGLQIAKWLAGRGARRIVLAGRRGLPPRHYWDTVAEPDTAHRISVVRALEATGVSVRPIAVDITNQTAVTAALQALDLPPVRGIVHAAGVMGGALALKTRREQLAQIMLPKVRGAMVLDALFPPGTLDFLVLFSSCGQLARLSGQTSYAAANAFLDTFATYRRANGCNAAVSLGWTSWLDARVSAQHAAALDEAESRGFGGLSTGAALQAWQFATRFDRPYYAITAVYPLPGQQAGLPVRSELTLDDDDGGTASTGPRWTDLPEVERIPAVVADLRELVGSELRMPPTDIQAGCSLTELGLDSVLITRLRARMNRRYGTEIPPKLLWDRPTIQALAEYLARQGAEELTLSNAG
jgi:acyl transferase domain-containing protein/NADP-dependent 3-hydroxy acid dehydrogenase YdfG/acyl carrier protein